MRGRIRAHLTFANVVSTLCPGGRARIAAIALALTATIGLAGGVPASLADTGTVYVDGSGNVGAGQDLFSPSLTGNQNVGLGYEVMPSLTNGAANAAIGHYALYSNTSGNFNVATGHGSLFSNTTGDYNIASGYNALRTNTTGENNLASGYQALVQNTTGNSNVALGFRAGENVTGSDNIDIVNRGVPGESGRIRIGIAGKQTMAFLQGVYGSPISGQPVVVNSKGRLGTAPAAAKGGGQALSRLRAENRRQSDQLHQLHAAIQRLRQQIR
jgi:hypothetical protein